jgi:hypothetical protein
MCLMAGALAVRVAAARDSVCNHHSNYESVTRMDSKSDSIRVSRNQRCIHGGSQNHDPPTFPARRPAPDSPESGAATDLVRCTGLKPKDSKQQPERTEKIRTT